MTEPSEGGPEAEKQTCLAAVDHQADCSEDLSDLVTGVQERRRIDIAIGLLMELRRCDWAEAIADFSDAVREYETDAATLADALVDLGGGHEPSSQRPEALGRWGHLLALRGRYGLYPGSGVHDTARIRCGPTNNTIFC